MDDLALLYRSEREFEKADALLASVLAARRRVLGPDHPDTTDAMVELAEVRLQEEKYPAAESLLHEAIGNYEKTASDSWARWHSQSLLGASLAGQRKYSDSEAPLISGYRGMIDRKASIPFEERSALTQTAKWIIALYESWGKPMKAAEWQNQLCQYNDSTPPANECSAESRVAGKP